MKCFFSSFRSYNPPPPSGQWGVGSVSVFAEEWGFPGQSNSAWKAFEICLSFEKWWKYILFHPGQSDSGYKTTWAAIRLALTWTIRWGNRHFLWNNCIVNSMLSLWFLFHHNNTFESKLYHRFKMHYNNFRLPWICCAHIVGGPPLTSGHQSPLNTGCFRLVTLSLSANIMIKRTLRNENIMIGV